MHPADGDGQHRQSEQVAETCGGQRPRASDRQRESRNADEQQRPQTIGLPTQSDGDTG